MPNDPFIEGLRAIFSEKDAPAPATVSARAGLDKSAIRKMLAGESRSPKLSSAMAIAAALNTTVEAISSISSNPRDLAQKVPIVGLVGAGAHVPVFEAYEPGAGPRVACPPGLPSAGVVAVEIKGDSMEPVYSTGDLLFYTRHTAEGVPAEAIGCRCVCETEDGLGWVKQVRRGSEPGLFNLISLNPSAENQHDVRLKWAAPVLLHWPAQLARRMG